ncbi:MAG: hypothetical protein O3B42_09225 [Actinomycetota bacterium]|nr:hypothetical protein [Actinomycetota bacterium]
MSVDTKKTHTRGHRVIGIAGTGVGTYFLRGLAIIVLAMASLIRSLSVTGPS